MGGGAVISEVNYIHTEVTVRVAAACGRQCIVVG